MLFGHPVEILSIEKGRCAEPGPLHGVPMAMVTLRSDACLDSIGLLFDTEQCARLRDTFAAFLSDPQSWLYQGDIK